MDRINVSGSFVPSSDDYSKSSPSASEPDAFGNLLADIWGKLGDVDPSEDVASEPPRPRPVSSSGSPYSSDPADPFAAITAMQNDLFRKLKPPV